MGLRFRAAAWVVAVGLIVGVIWWFGGERGDGEVDVGGSGAGDGVDGRRAVWVEQEAERLGVARSGGAVIGDDLRAFAAELRGMERAEAVAGIRAVLEGGSDFGTGMGFVVGEGGQLEEWPSLRVFLLAELGEIDPGGAAVELAREVLATEGSADEWAVALRSLGRAGGEEALIRRASEAMLGNEAWRAEASVGYLEAFDAIVHTRHTGVLSELVRNCGDGGNRGVRHASFLTLFRLAQREPVVVLGELVEVGRGSVETGAMVAGLMAGADVRDAGQRAIIEGYLLDEGRGVAELERFCQLFPSANQMVSNNLLTGNEVIDGGQLAVADAAAMGVVESWLGDAKFERVHGALAGTRKRLGKFVKQ